MATCPSGHESADDDFCDVCGFAIGPVGNPSTIPRPSRLAPGRRRRPAAPAATAIPVRTAASQGRAVLRVVRLRLHPSPTAAPSRRRDQGRAPGNRAPGIAAALAPSAPPVRPPRDGASRIRAARPGRSPSAAPASAAPAFAAPQPAAPAAPPGPPWSPPTAPTTTACRRRRPGADGISFPVYCPQRRFRLAGAEVRIGRRSAHSGIDPEIDLTGPPADPGVSRLHAVLLRGGDGIWSVVDPGSANGTLVNGTEIARDQIVPLHDGDRIHLGAWTELRIISERRTSVRRR